MTANIQRRQFPRYPVDNEVTVEVAGTRLRGRLADVSDGGAFVRLSIDVPIGSDVLLALRDMGEPAPAKVRRVARDGFAIRFDQETVGRIFSQAARDKNED